MEGTVLDGLPLKEPGTTEEFKSCCASLYENEIVRFFLGDSFHPGGVALTSRLAERLGLAAGDEVLDIASGRGTSAIELARTHGLRVTGVDLSAKNCRAAADAAEKAGVSSLTRFVPGDAENLPVPDRAFAAVISECSFCIFPDKQRVANEMFRAARPGGRVGINDVILNAELPPEWQTYVARILCLADAKSFSAYDAYLEHAGFSEIRNYDENEVLVQLAQEIKGKLMLAQLAIGLGKLSMKNFDMKRGNQYIREALEFVKTGKAGYGMIVAQRP
jgi:ubiquinone/menaquinone biosynthesis C-methylase UbiE